MSCRVVKWRTPRRKWVRAVRVAVAANERPHRRTPERSRLRSLSVLVASAYRCDMATAVKVSATECRRDTVWSEMGSRE